MQRTKHRVFPFCMGSMLYTVQRTAEAVLGPQQIGLPPHGMNRSFENAAATASRLLLADSVEFFSVLDLGHDPRWPCFETSEKTRCSLPALA